MPRSGYDLKVKFIHVSLHYFKPHILLIIQVDVKIGYLVETSGEAGFFGRCIDDSVV